MSEAENMWPRDPDETEADWRERVAREVADTRLVAELLEIAAGHRGVTDAERAALRERIGMMQHERDRARALEMLAAEPAKPPAGSRGH